MVLPGLGSPEGEGRGPKMGEGQPGRRSTARLQLPSPHTPSQLAALDGQEQAAPSRGHCWNWLQETSFTIKLLMEGKCGLRLSFCGKRVFTARPCVWDKQALASGTLRKPQRWCGLEETGVPPPTCTPKATQGPLGVVGRTPEGRLGGYAVG